MRARLETELHFRSPFAEDDVVGFALAHRHRLVKEVGDAQQQVVKLPLDSFGLGQICLGPVGHLAQAILELRVARLRELLRQPVLLGFDGFRAMQVPAPLLVELQDLVDRRGFALELSSPLYALGVLANQLQWKHL